MSLYKYVTAERALQILRTGLIRFSQPAALNDPFELRPSIKSYASVETITAIRDRCFVERWNELPPDRKQGFGDFAAYRRAMLAVGSSKWQEQTEAMTAATPENERNLRIALNQSVGILCLTTNENNLTMWAHYADNHEGCVLGFDESHSFFDQRLNVNAAIGHVVGVGYKNQRPQQALSDLKDRDVFFVKSMAWEYENERRMMLFLNGARETKPDPKHPQLMIHLFSIPANCITTVILGCRMSLDLRHKLCETVRTDSRYSNVCVLKAVPNEQKFCLDFEDLNIRAERKGSMQIDVQRPDLGTLEELDVQTWPIWEKEASEFPWHYDEMETCYLLEGDVIVTPDDGEPVRFGKGDLVTFPKGMSCTWKVLKPVRKHYKFG